MKTRACVHCGNRITLHRTMVWDWTHRRMFGVWIKTPSGPFPDRDAVIAGHEAVCARDQIVLAYGDLRPLDKWTKSRT